MKNIIKIFLSLAVIAFAGNVSAQNIKLAHIDIEELIRSMPEYDTATVKMQKIETDIRNEIDLLEVEFRKKLDDYQKNKDNLTDFVRAAREEELNSMYQRIGQYQQNAEETLGVEQQKLLIPIQEKANKAIDTVAKEQGITYVFHAQMLQYKALGTLDLLPSVKQHLGIKK